eukprot:symbB.v1.2.019770.t1/scaffold1596.1/size109882/9
MDNAPERVKTWRVLRTQALVEIDSFLRQADPEVSQPLPFEAIHQPFLPEQLIKRRYDGTPTSTCSDLGKYLQAYAGATTTTSQDLAAVRLGLSPTSTQGELPLLGLDSSSRQVTQERNAYRSLTLDEIPEFRSYTMPELVAMEYSHARSRNTTLASLPEMEMDHDDQDEEETEVDNKWNSSNSFTL